MKKINGFFICSKQATEPNKKHVGSFYYINTSYSKETFIATYIVRKNTYHITQIFNDSPIHQKTSPSSPFKYIRSTLSNFLARSRRQHNKNPLHTWRNWKNTTQITRCLYDESNDQKTTSLLPSQHFQHRNLHRNLNIITTSSFVTKSITSHKFDLTTLTHVESLTLYSKTRKFLHNTSWFLSLQHQDTFLHNVDHLHIVINPILYTKTYIPAIHLSTRHDYVYHIYSALFLLRIFIDDFNNKKTNRRINRKINLQIKSHKIKNRLMILHLLLRLRYEILKRWKHIKRQSNLNNHSGLYSALDYQIRLFSMILTDSNSRIKSYEFKINFFLIRIIILLTHFKSIMLYHDLLRRQASTQYSNVETLLQALTISLRTSWINSAIFIKHHYIFYKKQMFIFAKDSNKRSNHFLNFIQNLWNMSLMINYKSVIW